ncbi:MAG: peptidoglycan-binding protein [Firmicutes bacterium]|nr:peptidoglycan-binding protein [Bacillota bacterium]
MEHPTKYPVQRGEVGYNVKLVQEWLCLEADAPTVVVDGDFGPATEAAVKEYQKSSGLKVDGIVTEEVFNRLSKPMTDALKQLPQASSLKQMVLDYALQHVKSHPRELRKRNEGPWVRLYCRGMDGDPYAWCCGFVSFILKQACETMGVTPPLKYTLDCDDLKNQATIKGVFKKFSDGGSGKPGDIFVIWYPQKQYWGHTGIALEPESDHMLTIEGNTNDVGSPEGYEACKRSRSYGNIGFISV